MDRNSYESCKKHVEDNIRIESIRHLSTVTTVMEAGTGSWYGVVVSPMVNVGGRIGGEVLIAVVSPWNTAYPFNPYPGVEIYPDYIAEKLVPRGSPALIDLAALTVAINKTLDIYFGVKK